MNMSRSRAAVSTNITPVFHFSFPALSAVSARQPERRYTLQRRSLLCGGVALVMLFCCSVSAAAPATEMQAGHAPRPDSVSAFVSEASQLFGIPASWIRAVMQVESAGDVRSVSPKGAMGLMQIMPETWAALRTRYGLGADPFDAHDNILAGAAYLRELHDLYGEPGFIAAYNAGPTRYEQHLATGQPLPVETQNYVATLTPIVAGEHVDGTVVVPSRTRLWADASLFVARSDSSRPMLAVSSLTHDRQQPTRTEIADRIALAPQSAGLFVATDRRTAHP